MPSFFTGQSLKSVSQSNESCNFTAALVFVPFTSSSTITGRVTSFNNPEWDLGSLDQCLSTRVTCTPWGNWWNCRGYFGKLSFIYSLDN